MEQPTGQDGRATRPSAFQAPRKKRNHRGGKKKRSTKQPFALPASEEEDVSAVLETSEDRKTKQSTARSPLQRSTLHRLQGRNSSNTSLESEALLDHRYVYGILFPTGSYESNKVKRAEVYAASKILDITA